MRESSGARSGRRVAFQGELGAFSEEAVHRFFGEGVSPVPCREFADVGRSVLEGSVDYGVLPIENTLAGSVVGSYDVLAGGELEIVGEVITPIHHCILGIEGASLNGLTRILSHPVALMQCTRVLRELSGVEAVAVYDTAGAAKDVAALKDPSRAAIAGRRAADRYGLAVLAADVEDRHDNQTRFLVVVPAGTESREETGSPSEVDTGNPRTALLIETRNSPGALLRVLAPFAEREINLSKLESRPAGEPWSYRFFMELDAAASAPETQAALDAVREASTSLRVLGTYPRWREAREPTAER